MKSAAAFWVGLFFTAATAGVLAQEHALSLPDQSAYNSTTTGIGTTSKSATGIAPPTGTPDERNTDESDPTLYRSKTSESENPMLRDEGALHFKTRPKERTHEVDDLKSLQSKPTDTKFEGSLINSGIASIDHVAEKAAAEKANDARGSEQSPEESKYQGDPRFAHKHLTFTPEQDDKPKKADADSSPSPSASPSASPAAKKSSDSKSKP